MLKNENARTIARVHGVVDRDRGGGVELNGHGNGNGNGYGDGYRYWHRSWVVHNSVGKRLLLLYKSRAARAFVLWNALYRAWPSI